MSGFEALEVNNIFRAIKTWAESQSKIDDVALVGSWARKEAAKNSDIEIICDRYKLLKFLLLTLTVRAQTDE
ncbi:MAG: hypothetical protein ACRC1Z_25845 [Waterburya sp.]